MTATGLHAALDIGEKHFWNVAMVGLAGAMLTGALVLEYGFDQAPCALCLTQRLLMAFAGLIALAGLAHNPRLGIYPVLSIAAILTGVGFALRQIYIQLDPDAASCGMELEFLVEQDYPIAEILKAMTQGTGSCAEPSLIPAASLAGFLVLAICCVQQLRMPR